MSGLVTPLTPGEVDPLSVSLEAWVLVEGLGAAEDSESGIEAENDPSSSLHS